MTPAHTILGVIVTDGAPSMRACVERGVDVTWFERPDSIVWQAAHDLYANNKPIDMLTVGRELAKQSTQVEVEYLDTLVDSLGGGEQHNLSPYIDMLVEDVKTRIAKDGLAQALNRISKGVEAERVIGDLLECVANVSAQDREEHSFYDVAAGLLEEWSNVDAQKGLVEWPTPELNQMIGRLSDEVVFLCAGPSVGKTALALQLCIHNALRDEPVVGAYCSLESGVRLVAERMIQSQCKVNTRHLRNGAAGEEHWSQARDNLEALRNIKMMLNTRPMDYHQIKAWAENAVANGAKFVVIDNLKQVGGVDSRKSGPERFAELSGKMAELKKHLDVPVIVLHHLDEDGNVRWSKELENDADILLKMMEDKERSRDPDPSDPLDPGVCVVEVLGQKIRGGERYVKRDLDFNKPYQWFSDFGVIESAKDFDEELDEW